MILVHKRLSVAAAAALTAIAAGLILCLSLFSGSPAAYAMEQTALANHQVRSCHVKFSPSEGRLSEAWIELNPDGSPLRARMDFLKTEDGDKVVILSAGKAEIWFKDKNSHTFLTEKNALMRIAQMQKESDPKLAFEALQTKKASGQVEISTQEPSKTGQPITLTVTSKDTPDQRQTYEVNPKTKLVERVAIDRREKGEWQRVQLTEYLDYNKAIDPTVFQLDVPKDAITVDQIHQKIGLEKGTLTDDQIAAKVAKEFFEALIAEDYKKAGLLLEGIPADKMKEMFGRFKIQRIIEIGKPVPGPIPAMQAIKVPVTVEWGKGKAWIQDHNPRMPLTDDETAKKAAQEFFEALIKNDIATAQAMLDKGLEFAGYNKKNAAKIGDFLVRLKLLRITAVGKPVPYPETKLLEVPVKVETELRAQPPKTFSPLIRPVYEQPGRWGICGGI